MEQNQDSVSQSQLENVHIFKNLTIHFHQRGVLKKKFKNDFELNVNENRTYQTFGDAAKAVHRGKLIALNGYIGKEKNLCSVT